MVVLSPKTVFVNFSFIQKVFIELLLSTRPGAGYGRVQHSRQDNDTEPAF